MDNDHTNYTYAEASNRLKEIITCIEEDNPDVDELINLADEAVMLIAFCREKLTTTDEKIAAMLEKLATTPSE